MDRVSAPPTCLLEKRQATRRQDAVSDSPRLTLYLYSGLSAGLSLSQGRLMGLAWREGEREQATDSDQDT